MLEFGIRTPVDLGNPFGLSVVNFLEGKVPVPEGELEPLRRLYFASYVATLSLHIRGLVVRDVSVQGLRYGCVFSRFGLPVGDIEVIMRNTLPPLSVEVICRLLHANGYVYPVFVEFLRDNVTSAEFSRLVRLGII